MNEELKRILQPDILAEQYSRSSWEQAADILNRPESVRTQSANLMQDLSFFSDLRDRVNQGIDSAYTAGSLTVLTPVGMFGLWEGFAAPDWDITTLGIGYHRYFLFHSAFGLALLRHFHRQWQVRMEGRDNGWSGRVKQKVVGALLGAGAAGVGIHLLVDVFQPKSIVFPFFGSLVEGTLVDDNLWLLGNSLWAFKISHDVFSLVLADEMTMARDFAVREFGELAAWRPSNEQQA